jgi:hypothetical protein
MYYQICISGTCEPLEETKNFKTIEAIYEWYANNQIHKPDEDEEGFNEWIYPDDTKYVFLPFTDDGVFIPETDYYLDEE